MPLQGLGPSALPYSSPSIAIYAPGGGIPSRGHSHQPIGGCAVPKGMVLGFVWSEIGNVFLTFGLDTMD